MCDDAAAAAVTALERDASGSGDDDHEAAAWRAVLTAARRVDRDVGCFNAIVTACERCGRWRHAVALLEVMNAGAAIDDASGGRERPRRPCPAPNANTFSAAISCCGKAGRWREALGLFDAMDRARVRKDAAVYYAVIAALQSAAQVRRAAEVTAAAGGGDGAVTEADGTVAEIMRHVQRVYTEGLASGFLQQWTTSGLELDPASPLAPTTAAEAGGGRAAFKREVEEATRAGASASASVGWARPPPDDALGAPPAEAEAETDAKAEAEASATPTAGSAGADGPASVRPPRVLDLHGFPLSVAKAAVDIMLKDVLHESPAAAAAATATAPADFDIHLITGRGNHLNNSGTRGVLRSEIGEYVREAYGLEAAPAVGNAGCLVVSHAALRRWLDAQRGGQ